MNNPSFKLNDNNSIPDHRIWCVSNSKRWSTYAAVLKALEIATDHIDTAVAYFNETEVGKAIQDSGISRDDIWITSKMWLQDYAYEDAKKAIDLSLKKLQTGYIDLYLIHQPYGKVDEAGKQWKKQNQ